MSSKKVNIYDSMFGVTEPENLGAVITEKYLDEILGYDTGFLIISSPIEKLNWDSNAYTIYKQKTLDKLSTEESWHDFTVTSVKYDDGQDFSNLNAEKSALVCLKCTNSNFTQASFNKAKIAKCEFINCNFDGADFTRVEMCNSTFEKCLFTNVKFGQIQADKIHFIDCEFNKCEFEDTVIKECDFTGGFIKQSSLEVDTWIDVVLDGTELISNNISKPFFRGIKIVSTKLTDNTINKADFNDSSIEDSELTKNVWHMVGYGKGNAFDNVIMTDEHMQRCTFKYSTWTDVKSNNMKVNNLDFTEAKLIDCKFVGAQGLAFNLVVARLMDTQFIGCDIPRSNWTGAVFDGESKPIDCSLEGLIYAYSEMKDYDILEPQIKTKSKADVPHITYQEVQKGYPTTKISLNSHDVPINPSYVKGYFVTGKLSLEGDISVTDTSSPMSNIELTKNKSGIETKAKASIGNAMGNISVKNFDIESAKPNIIFSCDLGIFNLNIERYTYLPNGNLNLKGSLSSNSANISKKYKDSLLNGELSLEFDLELTKNKGEYEEGSSLYVKQIVGIIMLGASVLFAPEIIPLAGIGLLVSKI